MSGRPRSDVLAKVYAATSDAELAAAYGSWSSEYDRDTASSGYCLPSLWRASLPDMFHAVLDPSSTPAAAPVFPALI